MTAEPVEAVTEPADALERVEAKLDALLDLVSEVALMFPGHRLPVSLRAKLAAAQTLRRYRA